MSDPASTNGPPSVAGGHIRAGLDSAGIEAVLADFRNWLTNLASTNREPGSALPGDAAGPAQGSPQPVDLFTLIGQFTALRHEVNLQTKAARAAVEQNAEVLRRLETHATSSADEEPDEEPVDLRAIAKAVVDIADALTLSLRQMEKFRDTIEPLLAELGSVRSSPPAAPEAKPPGFFARLFGAKPTPAPQPSSPAPPASEAATKPAIDRLRQLAASAVDGYAMSLRRVERILPTLELEPMACTGEPFDPEYMEVVEVVADSDQPAGTVVEEVRPGYLLRDRVFRFAQVKVAR